MTMYSVTIVRSHGPRLAKLVRPGSVIDGYGQCKTVDLFEMPVDGLGSLEELLRQLQPRWICQCPIAAPGPDATALLEPPRAPPA
jgi:hypothetical protein